MPQDKRRDSSNFLLYQTGFTLLEVILSIALIGVLAGMSIPVYESFQSKNDIDNAATTIAESMRRAELLSMGVKGDSAWGTKIDGEKLIIFKGADFLSRDQNFDEEYSLPSSLVVSGPSEIVFQKFTGLPNIFGTSTITSPAGETRSIYINEKGMVQY